VTLPEVRNVRWSRASRIVPTRYPAITLFDRVADLADFEALYALEAMTNPRLRDELGQIGLVAQEERLFGPGSSPIMAAFTHLNPQGSRFSDGAYGVFYAARDRATAVAETRHHHARFLAATAQGAMHLSMRLYAVAIHARLHDLRPPLAEPVPLPGRDAVLDPDSYAASQRLGRQLHQAGSGGLVYPSVRHAAGQCVGLFKPRGASACVHAAYLLYAWNGQQFTDIYEKTE